MQRCNIFFSTKVWCAFKLTLFKLECSAFCLHGNIFLWRNPVFCLCQVKAVAKFHKPGVEYLHYDGDCIYLFWKWSYAVQNTSIAEEENHLPAEHTNLENWVGKTGFPWWYFFLYLCNELICWAIHAVVL